MLKIVDRYIGRQVLGSTLIGVLVLTLVLVLGNLFKEIFELLVDRNLPLDSVLKFVAYIMPFSLIFTIPWGFLTAVLLVFGRMSADNEMVSMRVAGLSMARICRPVFLIAVGLAAISLWINTRVAPSAQREMKRALVTMVKEDPLSVFEADQVVDAFAPNVIYAKGKSGKILEGLEIVRLGPMGRDVENYIRADSAEMFYNEDSASLEMTLINPKAITPVIESADPQSGVAAPRRVLTPPASMALGNVELSLDALSGGANLEGDSTMPTPELRDRLATDADTLDAKRRCEIRTEIHKRYSFSMASITFALIAIPLGVTAHRRETSVGFAISLLIAIVYFLFIIMADTLSDRPEAFPYLLMWIPNVLFVGVGAVLFWRLSRR